ncbi:hypothetical protein HYFRA_00011437 [Hymenoscyphus fraxineus]|uniref:Uncharacterized protein n=1 Tax=Hymenoscyphus fraxineus TaxID=746836 RepID=A0A9N9PRZ8_9HELO|nr:hypothetical protein HYFRA_00011437 [Hymenoscyphus fraxineus]
MLARALKKVMQIVLRGSAQLCKLGNIRVTLYFNSRLLAHKPPSLLSNPNYHCPPISQVQAADASNRTIQGASIYPGKFPLRTAKMDVIFKRLFSKRRNIMSQQGAQHAICSDLLGVIDTLNNNQQKPQPQPQRGSANRTTELMILLLAFAFLTFAPAIANLFVNYMSQRGAQRLHSAAQVQKMGEEIEALRTEINAAWAALEESRAEVRAIKARVEEDMADGTEYEILH